MEVIWHMDDTEAKDGTDTVDVVSAQIGVGM